MLKSNIIGKVTRASIRGDSVTPHRRTTYSKGVLSAKGSEIWNYISVATRESTILNTFETHLKLWLKRNQIWEHELYANMCHI